MKKILVRSRSVPRSVVCADASRKTTASGQAAPRRRGTPAAARRQPAAAAPTPRRGRSPLPQPRSRSSRARAEQGRHRVDDRRDRAGHPDDDPGLALFYGGMVRAKNMLSVLMQVFVCSR